MLIAAGGSLPPAPSPPAEHDSGPPHSPLTSPQPRKKCNQADVPAQAGSPAKQAKSKGALPEHLQRLQQVFGEPVIWVHALHLELATDAIKMPRHGTHCLSLSIDPLFIRCLSFKFKLWFHNCNCSCDAVTSGMLLLHIA